MDRTFTQKGNVFLANLTHIIQRVGLFDQAFDFVRVWFSEGLGMGRVQLCNEIIIYGIDGWNGPLMFLCTPRPSVSLEH